MNIYVLFLFLLHCVSISAILEPSLDQSPEANAFGVVIFYSKDAQRDFTNATYLKFMLVELFRE